MNFQNRLLAAQLAPLVPLLITGLLAVAALWTMTRSVQQARAVQLRRMVTAAEATATFREEYALLERYAETGDPIYLEEARLRSSRVHSNLTDLGQDGNVEDAAHLLGLVSDYEEEAGLDGTEPQSAQLAARTVVHELELRHREYRTEVQGDLLQVVRMGRTTGAFVIFMVGVVMVIGGWLAYVVARDLGDAVRELERGTAALASGDFHYRIELGRSDELGQLATAFDDMANRIAILDRMKVDFFANVSHDLKTPLTSMSEAADLLDEEVAGPLTEDQRRLVRVLKSDVGRLRGLVANVLDLSRLGSTQAELTPGDVGAAVRAVLDDLQLLARSRDVALEAEIEPSLPEVVINRGMVEQVVMNLVSNAVKFSPDGGVVRVEVSMLENTELVRASANGVLVVVSDQGPGVPTNYQKRIFERFFQVPREEHRGGSGLGLYICREIVETHGGRIWVDDNFGGGARFCFTLVPGRIWDV
ncbi:MAG TPA: ATP-binding protein [Myxococcota bacterium]|nr:ATP-binding protein [Myxococcota bacterium]